MSRTSLASGALLLTSILLRFVQGQQGYADVAIGTQGLADVLVGQREGGAFARRDDFDLALRKAQGLRLRRH